MVNTCILYGTQNWIGINILIILTTFMIVAALYALSSIFPSLTKARLREASRSELTQAFISIVIIIVLSGIATGACSLSSSISSQLTGQSLSPFGYAEYYTGNLSTNTGLNLLTQIYSTSVSYSIEAQVLQDLGSFLNVRTSKIPKILYTSIGLTSIVTAFVGAAIQVGALFTILSTLYLDIIAPLVTVVVGLLFVQFLALPVLQYTAFSVVLPVAIGMRSVAFLGTHLKYASNTVLAIAIAGYIVYPLMVSFNGYVIAWIFSTTNPSYQYIHSTYVIPAIPINTFFQSGASSYTGFFGTIYSALFNGGVLSPLVSSAFQNGLIIAPWKIVTQAQLLVNETAQFIFSGLILFVMDVAVTIGFAMGLANALNAGVEGAGNFWGSL